MEDNYVMCEDDSLKDAMVCDRCMEESRTSGKQYALLLSSEQAKLLSSACEFYARMMMGQWEFLLEHICCLQEAPIYGDAYDRAEQHLLDARSEVFPSLEHSFCHSYGVGKFADADQIWEIYEVLRNRIAWTEHPEGGDTVDFDTPMSFSGKPLATCEFIEDKA